MLNDDDDDKIKYRVRSEACNEACSSLFVNVESCFKHLANLFIKTIVDTHLRSGIR